MLMVPTPEGSERNGKKMYMVKDISPAGDFIIDVLDLEHNPIKDTDFRVAIDNGQAKNERTDENGLIRIPSPKAKFDLYLSGKSGSAATTNEEGSEAIAGESTSEENPAEQFIVKIVDLEHDPIRDVEFRVAVDNGEAKNKRTDDEGTFKIIKPETKFDISFAGQEGSSEGETSAVESN
jgi:hypothetical protein